MSTQDAKRYHREAIQDAEAFRALFPLTSYLKWEIAGSVRRGKATVGDIEHVLIPAIGLVSVGGGLFTETITASLLWAQLDILVSEGTLAKHNYNGALRWGEKYRGVDFRGFNHELFTSTPDTWGSTLAIRTGPAEFSRDLVMGLVRNGHRNYEGKVWECRDCPNGGMGRCEKGCKLCQGTALEPVRVVAVPDEETFFALARMPWRTPEER
jgi:DNA polymerase/3'-5' exonuclease PolX